LTLVLLGYFDWFALNHANPERSLSAIVFDHRFRSAAME
jgi:hypothetical protein